VIQRHRRPLSTADDWIAEQADRLWEDWMRYVDQVLADVEEAERYAVRPVVEKSGRLRCGKDVTVG